MRQLFSNFQVGLPTGSIYERPNQGVRRRNANFESVLRELKSRGISTIETHHDFPDPEVILEMFPNASYHLTRRAKVAGAHNALKYGYTRIIAHPDYITDINPWKDIGKHLLIENMDHLDPQWRSAGALSTLLEKLPDAGVCLDLAHAIDKPSLLDGIISIYGSRIREIHLGEINRRNGHHLSTISKQSTAHCISFLHKVEQGTPIIFELALGASWKESISTVESFAEEYSC